MIGIAFTVAALLYGVSCVLFLALLFHSRPRRIDTAARFSLWLSAAAHCVYIGCEYAELGSSPVQNIQGTLSLIALLSVVGFLFAVLKYRALVLGSLLVPITLVFFLGAGLGTSVAPVPEGVRSVILPVHILVNIFGLVSFMLAAVAATAYIIQERMLRQKRLSGVSRRLPALSVLDTWSLRLVTVGFPLLTLGIVTGGMWAQRIEPGSPLFSTSQTFALAAWVVFAAVLMSRVAMGWQGRRAAIGTITGFLCTALVLVGYALRSTGDAL